jgi:siderophore synthetase component
VGLPESLTATHELMPVHPLTYRRELGRALAASGLAGGPAASSAVIAPGTGLRVAPTLSIRTVAVSGQPGAHVKMPLPTSTLGRLNRRLIQPGTLADGALARDVLAATVRADATDAEPLLGDLLLADEGSYAHAGHPCLGYLLRRLPPGLDRCQIVPVAGLLAAAPDAAAAAGRPMVIDALAGWAYDGDLQGLLGGYLEVLFGVHVRLFARYGIALEAHQQNTALVLGPPDGTSRLRLLVKDFDGTLIHLPRLAAALGPAAPDESAFADPRMITRSDEALADVFITIAVHLCAGALAFGLASRGVAALPELLALVRRKLTDALDDHAGWPATAVLRARVLDADRLPGKSMVTAGTLVAKERTGASDINKFYGTSGPNYLKDSQPARSC